MAELKEFIEWYQVYQEAAPLPPPSEKKYNVPQGLYRGVIDLWDKFKGRNQRKWGEYEKLNTVDQQRRDYQLQSDLRKQQANVAAGDPDDPNVRLQKSKYLVKPFYISLMNSIGNHYADKSIDKAFRNIAIQMSQMFAGVPATGVSAATGTTGNIITNQGRPIIATPVLQAMSLVQKDPMIDQQYKQSTWDNPFEILKSVIWPVFDSTPAAWYNANATKETDKRPPGSFIDMDSWERAVTQWVSHGPRTKTITAAEIETELANIMEPGDKVAKAVERDINKIIGRYQKDGHKIDIGKYDIENLIKKYAIDNRQEVADLLNNYNLKVHQIQTFDDLDNAIKWIEKRITDEGGEPTTNSAKVIAWAKANGVHI